MFEEEERERLEAAGYTYEDGVILDSEGKYVPKVDLGNQVVESLYGDDEAAYQIEVKEMQAITDAGFIFDENLGSSKHVQAQSFRAEKKVEEYLANPDENNLDVTDSLVRGALERKNEEGDGLYHTTPEDYISDNDALSEDPIIQELSEVNPEAISSLKDVKKAIKEIEEKDPDFDTRNEKRIKERDEALAKNSSYNPMNLKHYLMKGALSLVSFAVPEGSGMEDEETSKKYKELKAKEREIQNVASKSILQKEEKAQEELRDQYEEYKKQLYSGEPIPKDLTSNMDGVSDRIESAQKRIWELEDSISYDSDNVFFNVVKSIRNSGIKSLDSALAKKATHGYLTVLPAAERINNEKGSPEDEAIVKDYVADQKHQEYMAQVGPGGEAGKITSGLVGSLGFMAEMSLSPFKGTGKAIGNTVKNKVGKKVKGLVTDSMKASITKLGKALPTTVRSTLKATKDITGKVLKEAGEQAFTPLGMGSTYSKTFENSHPIIFDEKGNLLLDEEAHTFEATKLTAQYNQSLQAIEAFQDKKELTEQDKQDLKSAMSFVGKEGSIHGIERSKAVPTYQQTLDKMKSMKGFGAFYNAYSENYAEALSERVGELGIGKGAINLAKKNKFTRALVDNKVVDYASKYSNSVNKFSGGHVHGIFDEIIEENIVPYIKHGLTGNDAHEIYGMRNWDAQKDVAIQTVLMNMLFRVPGAAKANFTKEGREQKAYLKSLKKKAKADKERLSKLYSDISEVRNSEELNKVIDLTAIPGQNAEHTINQVTNLRAEGKDKEASNLEETMFHYNAIAAVATNTEADFKWAMKKLQREGKSGDLASSQNAITKALKSLEKYKAMKDSYKNKQGSDLIVQNLFNKELHEQEIERESKDLTSKITKNREEVSLYEKALQKSLEEFDDKPHTNATVGSTILGRQFADPVEQAAYNYKLIEASKKFSPELQGIVNVSIQKLGTLNNSLKAINEVHTGLNNSVTQKNMYAKAETQKEIYKSFLKFQGELSDNQVEEIVKETLATVKKGDSAKGIKPTNISRKAADEILMSTKSAVKKASRETQITKNTQAKKEAQAQLELPLEGTPVERVIEGSENSPEVTDILGEAEVINTQEYGEASTLDADSLALLGGEANPLESRRKVTKPLPKKFIEAIKNYVDNNLQSKLGREATFQDLIEGLIKSSTYQKIDDTFDTYAKAWKALGRDTSKVESVYNTFFSPVTNIVEMGMDLIDPNVTTTATVEEVEEQVEKEEVASEKATTKRKQYNPNTGIAKVEETKVDDGKTLSSDTKFAYNFQQLKYINGEYRILSRNLRPIKEVDPNSNEPIELVDNRYILDPEFTSKLSREGTKLTVKAIDVDGVAVGGGKTWGQAKEEHAGDTQWIQDNMPMAVIYDNPNSDIPVVLSMVHTTSWYNKNNISTRDNGAKQDEVIEKGIENVRALRDQVTKNGEAKITIDNISTGPWHKTNKQLETAPITINEATGDSTLAVMKLVGNKLVPIINSRNEAFNDGVVQSDLEGGSYNPGEVVDIRQIGTDKKGNPIYSVFKVLVDSPTIQDKPELRNDLDPWIVDNLKFATLTSIVLNNKDNKELLEAINKKYNFNVSKAEKLEKEVYAETSISVSSDLSKYFGVFVQVGQKGTTLKNRFASASLGSTLFDNNVNNEVIITNKTSDNFGSMSIGSTSTNTNATLKNIERAFGSLGITRKGQFNLDLRHLGKKERFKVSKISKGEIVPDTAQTFDSLHKSLLKTNLVSHEIETIDGEKKWITAVQPKITFKLEDKIEEVAEPTVLEKAKEAVKETQEKVPAMEQAMAGMSPEQQLLFQQMLSSGQVKTQGTLESRRVINDAERATINNESTNKIEGLTARQQSEVTESLMNLIISNLNFTDKFNTGVVKEAIERSVDTHLVPLLSNLKSIHNNIQGIPGLEVSAQDFQEKIEVLENVLAQQSKLISTELGNPGSLTTKFTTLLGEVFEEDVDIIAGVEEHSKSFLEKDITLSYSNQLKLSLYGYPKKNQNNNEVVNFLGTPEFHKADTIVNRLKEITSTTPSNWDLLLERLEDAAEVRQDPLYLSIKNTIENHPPHLKWELLYKNISKKLNIYKVINSIKPKFIKDEKGKSISIIESYNLQVYDENSSKEEIRWKQEVKAGFMSAGFATLNHKADEVMNKVYARNIQAKLVQSAINQETSFEAIKEQFDAIGLNQFSDNTVKQYMKENEGNLYGKGSLLALFNTGLTTVLKQEGDIYLDVPKNNPFTNMGGIINDLIEKEITLNGSFVASSIRVNGKTMQGVIANTSFYDITQELSSSDSNTLDTYLSKEYTKDNYILNYLKVDQKFRASFTKIGFSSPDTYKLHGHNNAGDTSIDKISEQDNLANTFGVYSNTKGNLGLTDTGNKIPQIDGISFRAGQMLSNTLSDKGRLLYMNTLLADLKRNQITYSESGEVELDVFLEEFLVGQMFTPELNRIIQSHKEDTNIKGYDNLSKLFLAIPSFNSIEIGGKNIHELLAQSKNGYELSKDDMADAVKQAGDRIKQFIASETKAKIDIKEKTGSLYRLGFYKEAKYAAQGETSLHNIDSKYVASKGIADPQEALRFFTSEFIINNMLNQNNIYQIYLGDLAFYSKDKMLPTKQIESKDESGRIIKETVVDYEKVSDPKTYGKILKQIGVTVDKRAASLIAPGQALADSANGRSELAQDFIHIAMEDVVGITDTMVELIEARYEGEFTQEMDTALGQVSDLREVLKREDQTDTAAKISDIGQYVVSGELSRGVELSPNTPSNIVSLVRLLDNVRLNKDFSEVDLSEDISLSAFEYLLHDTVEDHFTDLASYFEIEGTDAQEYTTWKTHIDMLFRQGKLTVEEESLLQSAYNKLSANNGQNVSKEELKVLMQPVKPVYTGLIPHGNVMRPVYIKSSAFPLLPQLTKNLKIDSLRDKMESLEKDNNKPVRVSYQTANKIGAVKSKLTMNSIYDKSLEELTGDLEGATSILPMKNLRIQQETPSKENKFYKKNKDAQITLGSQFFKIILGNGINHETRELFPNIFAPELLAKLGISHSKKNLSGVDLDTIYREAYFEYSDTLQESLHTELGIKVGEKFHELSSQKKTNVIRNLHKILKREVDTRDYPEFLKDSLDLTTTNDGSLETIMPLMFDPNSHKFESLLQALISNRLIVHTLPGNGHIAASSEGFQEKKTLDTLSAEDRTGIVWLDSNRSKSLQPTYVDGELKESEVLIQSHYKVVDENGEASYVDLSSNDYSEDILDDVGNVIGRKLRLDKIDPQLLTNFTFRIPTSSHQSGVIIKVAGFLPREMGDILIVPKEHTTQLGEDYDIDKRFVYKSNYTIDKDGNIKRLEYENIEEKIKEINTLTEGLSDEAINAEWDNLFKEFNSGDLQQELLEELKELGITPNSKDKVTASKRVLNKLKVKMLENTLIDIYKSVYSSPSADIQKKIFKPLVTDIAEGTAELMESKLVSEEDLTNFSIYSDEYQRYLLNLGADGKGGIGVHSNAVTLEAQLQRVDPSKKVTLQKEVSHKSESGEVVKQLVPFEDSLGGFAFKGELGANTQTFDGAREIAEHHGENQNVSTDNINKQIMGKRNENAHTMSVYALLAHMGYDLSKDNVVNEYGDNTQMHLPSLLMNQPIIREYVKLMDMFSGVTQGFNPNIEKEIVGMLATQYGFPLKDRDRINTQDFLPAGYGMHSLEQRLSGQELWDNLKEEEANSETQMAVLQKFFIYKEYAKQLSDVQGLINLSSSKLGVSYFESNQRVEMLNKVGRGEPSLPGNSASLIGERIPAYITDEGKVLTYEDVIKQGLQGAFYPDFREALSSPNNGGYTLVGDFYWKPTTNEGKMLINSLSSADTILPIFYPYNSPTIKGMITNIFSNKGADPNKKSSSFLKWKYEIMSEFTNFISSNVGLSSSDVNQERERLFFKSSGNIPLASIINDLNTNNHPIMDNVLLKDLKTEIGVDGKQSSITHSNTQGNSLDSNAKYNAFKELVQDETVLGVYNGEALTVSMLAQDLATYAYLSDNQNGATGFKNYISVSYLNALNITGNYRRIFKHIVRGGKDITDRFERQYFQHHPERAVVLDGVVSNGESVNIGKKDLPKDINGNPFHPNYISLRNSKKKIGKQWNLFEKSKVKGNNTYTEVETLGDDKYNEFDSASTHQNSSLEKSLVKLGNDVVEVEEGTGRNKKKVIKVKLPDGTLHNYSALMGRIKGKSVTELVKFFSNKALVPDSKREFTLEILQYLDPNIKVTFGIPNNNVLGNYSPDTNTIMLHENLLNETIGLADNSFVEGFNIAREVVTEEAIHAITATEFDKYVESKSQDGTNIVLKEDAPEFAKRLVAMYEAAKTSVPYQATDSNTYYSKNIYEFMAGVFVSPEYRAKLDAAEGSILKDFKDMLKSLFKLLYKSKTNATLSYDSEVFNAIKEMLQVSRTTDVQPSPESHNSFETFRKAQEEVVIPGDVSRPLQDKILSLQTEKKDPLNC